VAIDTETKRRSVHGYAAGGIIAPVADGSIGAGDRVHMAWLYSGLATEVAAGPSATAKNVYRRTTETDQTYRRV